MIHLQIWQYLDPEKEDGEIEELVEPTSHTFSLGLRKLNKK
jgi:hypothetical protein